MVKNNHKMLEKEENTLSFVKVDYDEYLYEEDGQNGIGLEEEYDISFGARDKYAVKTIAENGVNRRYRVRINSEERRYGRYEGYDDLIGDMERPSRSMGDSMIDNHPSSILRQLFKNHLILGWAEERQQQGRGYQRPTTVEATYKYSFAGVRMLCNEGSSGSSGDITVRTRVIKRNGELRRYAVRDIITNVWDDGRLCSWTRDSSMFTEGRNETMYSSRAIYRYYDTMLQGISNRDLSGANRTSIRKTHLAVVIEDYKENYLERLEQTERRDVAIQFAEEKIEYLRNSGDGNYEVTTAELATFSDYSDRYFLEFAN